MSWNGRFEFFNEKSPKNRKLKLKIRFFGSVPWENFFSMGMHHPARIFPHCPGTSAIWKIKDLALVWGMVSLESFFGEKSIWAQVFILRWCNQLRAGKFENQKFLKRSLRGRSPKGNFMRKSRKSHQNLVRVEKKWSKWPLLKFYFFTKGSPLWWKIEKFFFRNFWGNHVIRGNSMRKWRKTHYFHGPPCWKCKKLRIFMPKMANFQGGGWQ